MREIRLHGSEGGGADINRSFLPLSLVSWLLKVSRNHAKSLSQETLASRRKQTANMVQASSISSGHRCRVNPELQARTVKAHQASVPTHARTIPKPVQMRTRRLSDSRLLVRFQTIAVVDRPLERW